MVRGLNLLIETAAPLHEDVPFRQPGAELIAPLPERERFLVQRFDLRPAYQDALVALDAQPEFSLVGLDLGDFLGEPSGSLA
jgi:hypothetical protein